MYDLFSLFCLVKLPAPQVSGVKLFFLHVLPFLFMSLQVMQKLYFQLPLVRMGDSWPVALGTPLFVYGI
jgi:hypothetical protein